VRWLLLAPVVVAVNLASVALWITAARTVVAWAPAPAEIVWWIRLASPLDPAPRSVPELEWRVARSVGQRGVYCQPRSLPGFVAATPRHGVSAVDWDCAPGDRDKEANAGLNCPLYRVSFERSEVRVRPIGSGRLRPDRVAVADKWQRAWRWRENRRLRKPGPGGIPARIGPKALLIAFPWQVSGLCRRLRAA
jgi:hypothetical protein